MAATVLGLVSAANAGMTQRIGAGATYWHTLDEIKDARDYDQDGMAWFLSYQCKPVWLLFLEVQVAQMPEGYLAASEAVYAPEALLGVEFLFIYGAVGIGAYYTDGEWSDDPFYDLRAGVNLGLLPFLKLDLYGNYRFMDFEELDVKEDVNADTLMFGAALRLEF